MTRRLTDSQNALDNIATANVTSVSQDSMNNPPVEQRTPRFQMSTDNSTLILGAGLAGLGAALSIDGARIYEAADHPGGHAYSRPLGEFHFDQGAHIVHSKTPSYLQLIADSCPDTNVLASSTVKNYWNGSFIGYPVQNHLADLPESMRASALSALVRANVEWAGREPRDYAEWVRASYGTVLADEFYSVFTEKYWRRPMSSLGTDWLAGRLIPTDLDNIVRGALGSDVQRQEVFKTFRYPKKGGFFGFFEQLYDRFDILYRRRAVELDPKRKVVTFDDGSTVGYEHLISTIPLPELVSITTTAPAHIQEAAKQLHHTKLLCVNIVVGQPKISNNHWFYVYDQSIEAARVSIPSNLIGSDTPSSAIQAEVFRDHREDWNPEMIAQAVEKSLKSILGFSSNDVITQSWQVVPHAYVISDLNRSSATKSILDWLETQSMHTAGLYGRWHYLWSDQALASGIRAANKILETKT